MAGPSRIGTGVSPSGDARSDHAQSSQSRKSISLDDRSQAGRTALRLAVMTEKTKGPQGPL